MGLHDVYLVDYRLGQNNGVDLVREARGAGSRAPIIMLTGEGTRTVDIEAMEAGASDFLEKGRTSASLLERSIRYAITEAATTAALERALAQISAIERVGRALAQDGPRPETLDEAVSVVVDNFGMAAASLYLMDQDTLRLAASSGYADPRSSIDPRGGRLGRAIDAGRAQVIPNVTIDPESRAAGDPMELCVPLVAEGACVGIMNVAWDGSRSGDDAQRGILLIGDRIAVALALNRAIRGRSFTQMPLA